MCKGKENGEKRPEKERKTEHSDNKDQKEKGKRYDKVGRLRRHRIKSKFL